MNIEFPYIGELFKFAQVLTLGAVLSIVVMYIIEILKSIIVTTHTKIFAALCFIISMAFGVTWSATFADGNISFELSVWLGVCLWLGANGFFKYLEKSDSWLGKTVKSYSEYLSNVVDKQENLIIEELKKENTKLSQEIDKLKSECSSPNMGDNNTNDKLITTSELKCACNGKYCNGFPVEVDSTLLSLINKISEKYNTKLNIVSAIRCKKYNEELTGSSTSKHLSGKAVDFSFDGMNKAEVIEYLNGFEETDYAYTNSTNMKDIIHLQVQ